MKDSAKHKLKTILLSAIAALTHNNANAETLNSFSLDFNKDQDAFDFNTNRWSRVYKNVARIDKNGEINYIASHRSHMSHRSSRGGGGGSSYGHRSHYSHYSSRGGGSSHYSSSSSYSRSSNSTPAAVKPHVKTPGEYSYGDRTLKTGIYGSDVTSLTGYLANALYLKRSKIAEKSGYSLYDATVVAAVKHFQKDAGLAQTGIADNETLTKLKSWDSSNTSVDLGMRELSFYESRTEKGTDVTELVNLLTKAGFAPDPTKIVMSNGKTEYTKDIATAVRLFQAYKNLTVTGTADEATINALRSKTK